MVRRRNRETSSYAACEEINHGYQRGRSSLNHVLPAAGIDHEESQADQRRNGYQPECLCVCQNVVPKTGATKSTGTSNRSASNRSTSFSPSIDHFSHTQRRRERSFRVGDNGRVSICN